MIFTESNCRGLVFIMLELELEIGFNVHVPEQAVNTIMYISGIICIN